MKNKNGITLIALVITIIVLLILAGVSLSLVLEDNGIIEKSQKATTVTKDSEEKEKIEMAVAAARAKGINSITTENLNEELRKTFGNEENTIENTNYWYYKSITDKNYRIYKDGKVELGNLLPDEYQQIEYIESTGTQWIDTKLLATNYPNMNIEIKGNYTTIVTASQYVFGANKNRWAIYIIRSI